MKNKILKCLIITIITATLVGCGSAGLEALVNTDIKTAVEERKTKNLEAADNLYNMGLMSKNTHDNLVKNINTQCDAIVSSIGEKNGNDFTSAAKKAQKRLLSACSSIYVTEAYIKTGKGTYEYWGINPSISGTDIAKGKDEGGFIGELAGNSLAWVGYSSDGSAKSNLDNLKAINCPVYVIDRTEHKKRYTFEDYVGSGHGIPYFDISSNAVKMQALSTSDYSYMLDSNNRAKPDENYKIVRRKGNGTEHGEFEHVSPKNGLNYLGDGGIDPLPLVVGNGNLTYYYDEETGLYAIYPGSSTLIDDINKYLTCPIYVLDWTKFVGNNSKVTLDEVSAVIQQSLDEASKPDSDRQVTASSLAQYFKQLSINGVPVTLMDIENPNAMIINVTKEWDYDETKDTPKSELGYDMIISQSSGVLSGSQRQMDVKLVEFNQTAIDLLEHAVTGTGNKYYFLKGGESKGSTTNSQSASLYLMEYPVGILNGFSSYDDEYIEATVDYESTCLAYNIYTGKYAKYSNAWDMSISNIADATGKEIMDENNLLKGTNFNRTENVCSVKVCGFADVPIIDRYTGNGQDKITILGRTAGLVLRDYQEAVYAPDIVEGEGIVAFGRKLRFNDMQANVYGVDSTSGTERELTDNEVNSIIISKSTTSYTVGSSSQQNDLVATRTTVKIPRVNTLHIYNSEGIKDDLIREDLSADDLADWDELYDGKKVKYLANPNSKYANTAASGTANKDQFTGDLEKLNKVSLLEREDVDSIKPIRMLGTSGDTGIAKKDAGQNMNVESKPIEYCLCVSNSVFDYGLFDWINSADEDGSVAWWNKWLSDRKYAYNIDLSLVQSYLNANYIDELSDRGIITLDMNVIEKIQRDINANNLAEANEGTRSIYVIVGVILTLFGLALLVLWAIDTQSGIGCNIIERITLGNWVAVSFKSEEPNMKVVDKTYITFGKAVVISSILIVLGLILMYANINMIMYNILYAISGVIEFITNAFGL